MSDRRTRRLLAFAALTSVLLVLAVPAGAGTPTAGARGGHVPTGNVVVTLEDGAYASAVMSAAGVPGGRVRDYGHGIVQVDPPAGTSPEQFARRLAHVPGVRVAAPEGHVVALSAMVPPDDPLYPSQRTYLGSSTSPTPHAVNLEPAWDRAFNGSTYAMNPHRAGIRIAIIDTGVSMPFAETTGEFLPAANYTGAVPTSDTADDDPPWDHGTRVASVIRAKTANGTGIAGVLHSSVNQVLVYRVLVNGSGETAWTVAAIKDAANRGAKVINCSLGEPLYESGVEVPGLRATWTEAVDYATSMGSVVVAASGNSADAVYAPAAVPSAVAVGAIDPATGLRASFSCTGTELDVCAPGVGVYTAGKVAGSYWPDSGTSFATPIASGSLALLWSLVPDTPASQMAAFVSSTASDYPSGAPDGFDPFYGNGRIDVAAAYNKMVTDIPLQPPVAISATPARGYLTTLSWDAAQGTSVFYAYGCAGGREYVTASTSAQVFLEHGGANTVYVKAFAGDRWSNPTPATIVVNAEYALDPPGSTRLEGVSRYATAAQVSRAAFPGGAPAVMLASGQNWPDALGAAALAGAVKGPLLLTTPGALSLEARDEIVRLKPTRVFVVGGTAALSSAALATVDSLSDADAVTRLSGADRFATAAKVADTLKAELGSVPGATAYVSSGENYPDALAGAALAAASGRPILLVRRSAVPAATRSALARLGIRDTVVLGGTSAVSSGVYGSLPSPERVAGADRYATARAVADHGVARGVLGYTRLGIATGSNFPDALGAGAYMGAQRGPLVLVPSSVDAPLRAWLNVKGPSVADQTVFGGPGAVPYALENEIRSALRP